ncbi:MAG: 30S ribosomal protein S6--L-glutamate ligase [Candidatus Hydrogenedentes bacterium]|nr:30S ribosomal protein S6--L-glutamate ligase [Candidatus Hydrogenedentota bacterium]
MKLVILSRDAKLYSTRRLAVAAQTRGHAVRVIDPLRCYMNIAADQPSIHYRGKELDRVDAIVPRIAPAHTFYGTAVVRQFEIMGVHSLNSATAITGSRDKLHSLQLLARHGVDMPVTGFAHSPDDTEDLVELVGGTPLVIKLVQGTQGNGVVLAETQNAAESVIDAFRGLDAQFLVQEFIEESRGVDIRCIVLDGEVVAAMMRKAGEGEFRANLHRGGKAEVTQITEQERAIASRAAEILGLKFAGVDILRAKRGPVVLEVNSSPGLEGIETVTGLDIAGMVIGHLERTILGAEIAQSPNIN